MCALKYIHSYVYIHTYIPTHTHTHKTYPYIDTYATPSPCAASAAGAAYVSIRQHKYCLTLRCQRCRRSSACPDSTYIYADVC